MTRRRPIHLLSVLALAGLAATPATAQQGPDPRPLYSVTGVAPGASIAVRQQPSHDGERIGQLPAEARDVAITGAFVTAGQDDWEQVILDGGEQGWIESGHLEAQNEDIGRETFPLQCTGTEPFWGLTVGESVARFTTPEIEPVQWSVGERRHAGGLIGRFFDEFDSSYGKGHMAVIRGREACSDGMSDILYPYDALLMTPGQAVRGGCCRRAGEIEPR